MNITEFLKKDGIPFTIYETHIKINRYLNLHEYVDVDKIIDIQRNLYASKEVQFNCVINVKGSFYGYNNTLQPGTYIGSRLYIKGINSSFNLSQFITINGYLTKHGFLS